MAFDSLNEIETTGANVGKIINIIRMAYRHNNEAQTVLKALRDEIRVDVGDNTIELDTLTDEHVTVYLDADLSATVISRVKQILSAAKGDYDQLANHVTQLPPNDV